MTTFHSDTTSITARPRVALIHACWHEDIVLQFVKSFEQDFKKLDGRTIDVFSVPGAYEIPLKAKALALSGSYAAIVCTALVVDGGIYRHDFVASAVIDGMMRAQLDTGVPVFSGVLTPHDFMSEGRHEFFHDHFVIKGSEAASACASILAAEQEAAA